jgi:hypothetical protein
MDKFGVLDRVVTRIKDGLTEADGLRISEHEGGVVWSDETNDPVLATNDPATKIMGLTVDGVDISITVNLTP